MSQRRTQLHTYFVVEKYTLKVTSSGCHLTIDGRKLPPPNRRITLHQKGLKIDKASIVGSDKKGSKEYEIDRINHLPGFQEVRLHSTETIFPGPKKIELDYNLPDPKLKLLKESDGLPSRELMPSIDENNTRGSAKFELIYTDESTE